MSRLILPAGQSIKQIAARLGVPLQALQQHAKVQDADVPLIEDKHIDIPDGFLRSRAQHQELTDAMSAPSGKRQGMNMWLAMDIEQKRARQAGQKHRQASPDETDALAEAHRTYHRFASDSNALAIKLLDAVSLTHNSEIRAAAFAALGCAHAQRALLFGEVGPLPRTQALSAAKAAQLANPKLADGHLAMALALQVDGSPADQQEALGCLQHAVFVDPTAYRAWAAFGSLQQRLGDPANARLSLKRASNNGPDWLFTRLLAAALADTEEQRIAFLQLASKTYDASPIPRYLLAFSLKTSGKTEQAGAALKETIALCHSEAETALYDNNYRTNVVY